MCHETVAFPSQHFPSCVLSCLSKLNASQRQEILLLVKLGVAQHVTITQCEQILGPIIASFLWSTMAVFINNQSQESNCPFLEREKLREKILLDRSRLHDYQEVTNHSSQLAGTHLHPRPSSVKGSSWPILAGALRQCIHNHIITNLFIFFLNIMTPKNVPVSHLCFLLASIPGKSATFSHVSLKHSQGSQREKK